MTIGITSAVLKVPITSLCFPPASLAVTPEQQDFVPATQDHSSSIALREAAESGTSQLQLREGKIVKTGQWLLPFTVPAPGAVASCLALLPLLLDVSAPGWKGSKRSQQS